MPRTPSKFGPAARRRFLDHLQATGHLGQSATAAGVSYKTVRRRLLADHRLYGASRPSPGPGVASHASAARGTSHSAGA